MVQQEVMLLWFNNPEEGRKKKDLVAFYSGINQQAKKIKSYIALFCSNCEVHILRIAYEQGWNSADSL
jgi:hypothetical protein